VSEDALDADLQAQLARGREAQSVLAQQLMARLSEALDSGGPEAAIEVCADEALRITYQQQAVSGVMLGRSSQRLRNPLNEPPEWAAAWVASNADTPVIMAAPDGRLGALTPIRLKPECEMCHGPVEGIDEQLLARIRDRYPEDRATGFEAGDLRGWFWFEVPAVS